MKRPDDTGILATPADVLHVISAAGLKSATSSTTVTVHHHVVDGELECLLVDFTDGEISERFAVRVEQVHEAR